MDRQLFRSRENKLLAGVCGGIAEYFNIDPVIIRIIWLAIGSMGAGVFLYIIAVFLVPIRPEVEFFDKSTAERDYGKNIDPRKSKFVLGSVLILIGGVFILRELFHWFDIRLFWPLLLIAGGLIIILKDKKH